MSRVAITEYAAKKLLLGDSYSGATATADDIDAVISQLPEVTYVIKVDTGVKKRGKAGLVKVNVQMSELKSIAQEFFAKGHNRVIIETFLPHEETREGYLSINLARDNAVVLHSERGGISIEEHHDAITEFHIPRKEALKGEASSVNIPNVDMNALLSTMARFHFSFLEINPYIVDKGTWLPLDLAVEIDSAKASYLPSWSHEHILGTKAQSDEEKAVEAQDDASQSSLTLRTLHPNGSILTLLSGGGASLVAMDSLVSAGLSDDIINYSEYSGAPTRDELHAYANSLFSILFKSSSKKKVVLIAGGVANFTDIMETFAGIMDAMSDRMAELKAAGVKFIVRRGGPNQEAALERLRNFLTENGIEHEVYGPSFSLGDVGVRITSMLA